MGNSVFRFKKFTIEQKDAAMKLGIDSVALGALVDAQSVKNILDIGTGTGILALMMAQRFSEAKIMAIDIDAKAYQNAVKNVENSDYSNRIRVQHCSLQDFATTDKYDIIISNPPYFNEAIKPDDHSRKTARHTDSLPLNDLFKQVARLLEETGNFWCIFPTKNRDQFEQALKKHGLWVDRIIWIKHHAEKSPKRFVAQVNRSKSTQKEEQLILKEGDDYSTEFKALTKDFYLHF